MDQKKREVKLSPVGLKQAEYEFHVWVAAIETGVSREDLLEPAFWSHVAKSLRPFDVVIARADDGSYWAAFLVLACDRAWARLQPLVEANLSTPDVSLTQAEQKVKVEWKGPNRKWSVIRVSDNEVVFKDGQTRTEAETWVREHPLVG